jgi:hypothetical protein
VGLRIQRSRATVKDLHHRLQQASRRDEARVGRRMTRRIALRVPHGPVAMGGERWGRRPACLSAGPQAVLRPGLASVGARPRGGRPPQGPPRQPPRWGERRAAGPLVVGGETAGGHAV